MSDRDKFQIFRVTWHGFKRAGGLMLGASLSYPWNIGGHSYWHCSLHLLVVTIRVSVKGKLHENRQKKQEANLQRMWRARKKLGLPRNDV